MNELSVYERVRSCVEVDPPKCFRLGNQVRQYVSASLNPRLPPCSFVFESGERRARRSGGVVGTGETSRQAWGAAAHPLLPQPRR